MGLFGWLFGWLLGWLFIRDMAVPTVAVVVHDFTAQEEDELDLVAGETVEVLRFINDSWCMVRSAAARRSSSSSSTTTRTHANALRCTWVTGVGADTPGPAARPHRHLPQRVHPAAGGAQGRQDRPEQRYRPAPSAPLTLKTASDMGRDGGIPSAGLASFGPASSPSFPLSLSSLPPEDIEKKPVFQFLAEINLLEYARSFVENGIDSIDGLTEFTDAQLDRIGVIPSEHRRCAAAGTLRGHEEEGKGEGRRGGRGESAAGERALRTDPSNIPHCVVFVGSRILTFPAHPPTPTSRRLVHPTPRRLAHPDPALPCAPLPCAP